MPTGTPRQDHVAFLDQTCRFAADMLAGFSGGGNPRVI